MAEEALRVAIEIRLYERQGEPTVVRTDQSPKVRENRARRIARRQGLVLRKSPRRDPRAADYGRFVLVDPATNTGSLPQGYGMTLDDVERVLR